MVVRSDQQKGSGTPPGAIQPPGGVPQKYVNQQQNAPSILDAHLRFSSFLKLSAPEGESQSDELIAGGVIQTSASVKVQLEIL
jgi:hypothetical protein